jgi:hypothetical protein
MSGKHMKLRAWRRGGGTPVKTVLLGGAAWVSVSAVLAVAVSGEPLTEHGADPAALPSPSALPEDPDREPAATRSAGRDGEAPVLASPSADATQRAGVRTLVEELTGAGEDLAETATRAGAGATSTAPELSTSPSAEPESSPDPSGPRPSEPEPSDDPEPSEAEPSETEPSEADDPEEDDEPSDGPGPSLELPTVPPIPPIDLP